MTLKFNTFTEAEKFAQGTGLLHAGRPWRRLIWIDGTQVPVWCVTLAGAK